MNRLNPAGLIGLALMASLAAPAAQAIGPAHGANPASEDSAASHLPYRSGELVVKYRAQVGASAATAMKAAYGLKTGESMFGGRFERLMLPSALDVPGAVAMLASDPRVEYAEPNFLRRRSAAIPNDPLFGSQWGLRNTGQANFVAGGPAGISGADLNAGNAWDADGDGVADRAGRGNVVIAIIDDAFETTHPDLAANMVAGYDFVDNDSDPRPASSSESHGTAVAGAAAAVGNNGIGVAGAAWNERIMPLRFGYDVASQLRAFDYARLNGARIVNASYGGPGYSQSEFDAIAMLDAAGILFVASSGNQDSNLDFSGATYPANYRVPNVLAVAATNRQDGIASFSTFGPVTVPLAAPGLQIVTTTLNGRLHQRRHQRHLVFRALCVRHRRPDSRLPAGTASVAVAGAFALRGLRSTRRANACSSWRALWKSPRHKSAVPSQARRYAVSALSVSSAT